VEEYSKTTEDIEPLIGEMREKVKMLEDRKNNEKDFQVRSTTLVPFTQHHVLIPGEREEAGSEGNE